MAREDILCHVCVLEEAAGEILRNLKGRSVGTNEQLIGGRYTWSKRRSYRGRERRLYCWDGQRPEDVRPIRGHTILGFNIEKAVNSVKGRH